MSRIKKKCIITGCENMGASLGRHGKAKEVPFYSTRCGRHRKGRHKVKKYA